MTFSEALEHIKDGKPVFRAGWNGKGMWIALRNPSASREDAQARGNIEVPMTLPFIYMSTVAGDLVPWLASQTDILAEDWVVGK